MLDVPENAKSRNAVPSRVRDKQQGHRVVYGAGSVGMGISIFRVLLKLSLVLFPLQDNPYFL